MLEYYFYKLYGIDFDLKHSRIRQMCYDLVLEYQYKRMKLLRIELHRWSWERLLIMMRMNF